jgi:hypothetical protein
MTTTTAPEITPRNQLPRGVVESMRFRGKYGVRIRRTRVGELGRLDLPGSGPYVLEHREPGDVWRQWGSGFWDIGSAQWQRFTIWGGPRPAPGS